MVLLNKDKEIERLLDALMQEKRETARLREALREVMDLSHRRTTHPMSDEADYYRIARAALGEEK
jgi:hypothetical protein